MISDYRPKHVAETFYFETLMPNPDARDTSQKNKIDQTSSKQAPVLNPTLEEFVALSKAFRESRKFAQLGLEVGLDPSTDSWSCPYSSTLTIDEKAVPLIGYEDNFYLKFEVDLDRVADFLGSNGYECTQKPNGPYQFSTWRAPDNAHGVILSLPAIANEGLYAYPCKIGRKNQLVMSTDSIYYRHSPDNKPTLLRVFETKAAICIQTNPPSSYDEAPFVAKADQMLALHKVVVPEHKLFRFSKRQYGARWPVGDEIDMLLLAIAKTDWPLIAHNKNFGELSAMNIVELRGLARK